MTHFSNSPQRAKYGLYAHSFSEADRQRLERGLEAQVSELEALFIRLAERNEARLQAGELSSGEYLQMYAALERALASLRSLRRTMAAE